MSVNKLKGQPQNGATITDVWQHLVFVKAAIKRLMQGHSGSRHLADGLLSDESPHLLQQLRYSFIVAKSRQAKTPCSCTMLTEP